MPLTTEQEERYYRDRKDQIWAVAQKYNPIPARYAQCIYFWDRQLKCYTDMCSQFLNCNLGHGNKAVFNAIDEQQLQISHLSGRFSAESKREFENALIAVSPDNMQSVMFTQTGREGIKCAAELAQRYTKRKKVFIQHISKSPSPIYEEETEEKLSVLTIPLKGWRRGRLPYINFSIPDREDGLSQESEEVVYRHLYALREQIIYENPKEVAAIVVGCVHGESGCIIASRAYLAGIKALCNEFGIVFICDERNTAFGRCGKWLSVSNFSIQPDMIVFDNSVVSGYLPIGGVIVSDEFAKHAQKGRYEYKTAFKPHPLAYEAGLATIREYEKCNLLEKVRDMDKVFKSLLEDIKDRRKCVKDVYNIGMFGMIEIVEESNFRDIIEESTLGYEGTMKKIISMLISRGFYTHSRGRKIIIAPPLVIEEGQLREEFTVLDDVLKTVDETMM